MGNQSVSVRSLRFVYPHYEYPSKDQWLTDESIDFCYHLLQRKHPNNLYMTSFFYKRLVYNGDIDKQNTYMYEKVSSWTKAKKWFNKGIRDKQNIFDFDRM
eukprot:32179_1